eukprot:2328328-Pyramimonas_sp.AAC.1
MPRKRWSSLGAQKTTCYISPRGPWEPQEAPELQEAAGHPGQAPGAPGRFPGGSQEAPGGPPSDRV